MSWTASSTSVWAGHQARLSALWNLCDLIPLLSMFPGKKRIWRIYSYTYFGLAWGFRTFGIQRTSCCLIFKNTTNCRNDEALKKNKHAGSNMIYRFVSDSIDKWITSRKLQRFLDKTNKQLHVHIGSQATGFTFPPARFWARDLWEPGCDGAERDVKVGKMLFDSARQNFKHDGLTVGAVWALCSDAPASLNTSLRDKFHLTCL